MATIQKAKRQAPQQAELTVQRRAATGKRVTRRTRRDGTIPGIVYGRQTEPMPIHVNRRTLVKLVSSKAGERALITLRIEGEKAWEKPVLVKHLQHHPVDGSILHVDFHAIVLTQRLKVKVPILLKGEAVGVKQEGGILEHFLREVEVECLPTQIPSVVEFDISALKIGETVHVRDLTAPAHSKITSEPDGVIASIQMPKEEKPEEAAATAAEPEVLREKKPEEGAAQAGEAKGDKAEKTEKPEAKKDAKS